MAELNEDGSESGYIKIGFVTTNDWVAALNRIKKRLIDLQQGNPRKLVVVGMTTGQRPEEKALHALFDEHRVRRPLASEWVRVAGDVATWLRNVRIAERVDVSMKIGAGSRGGVAYAKGTNCCSVCHSPTHTKSRCTLTPRRPPLVGKEWTWRGKERRS